MYCRRCGSQNADAAVKCVRCGDALLVVPPMPGTVAPALGNVPNYLVQAILVTIFCCMPFGIVAIVYAAQVNGKVQAGDTAGAVDASSKAKMWAWISFGLGLAGVLLYAVFILIAVLAA
jgi:hypothetical protein